MNLKKKRPNLDGARGSTCSFHLNTKRNSHVTNCTSLNCVEHSAFIFMEMERAANPGLDGLNLWWGNDSTEMWWIQGILFSVRCVAFDESWMIASDSWIRLLFLIRTAECGIEECSIHFRLDSTFGFQNESVRQCSVLDFLRVSVFCRVLSDAFKLIHDFLYSIWLPCFITGTLFLFFFLFLILFAS